MSVIRLSCIGICPDGSWTKRGSYCYLAECTQRNAEQARESCASYDATLVSVHDLDEHLFITELGESAKCSSDLFHIGLRANSESLKWVWDDGTPSDYFKWDVSEPSGLTKSCALISTSLDGCWGNCLCDRSLGYICKRCDAIFDVLTLDQTLFTLTGNVIIET
ncbi:hypothetical protein CAPTEDRAFT_197978 [Capitella teleta]|uniref:C-type lectin domain-containing protein n=1 Tax=Capitella teleta TaxID=283909 RepID=R7UAH4_CAPTE|nr:hypothetical protein CAPTEDRAFT_197978 [Capitella teleta]|eukprot:ELU02949.1 hypothetical protein CAPTEDRAFT_197978 [Capitella teleta]